MAALLAELVKSPYEIVKQVEYATCAVRLSYHGRREPVVSAGLPAAAQSTTRIETAPVLRRHGDGRGRRARVPPAAAQDRVIVNPGSATPMHSSGSSQPRRLRLQSDPTAARCRHEAGPPSVNMPPDQGRTRPRRVQRSCPRTLRAVSARRAASAAKKQRDQIDVAAIPARPHLRRTCPATASRSNMTARRSSAGRCRRWAPRCRAASPRRSTSSAGETVTLRGAGRTDAGVHALGQVAHFDLVRDWPTDTVRAAVNFHLKPDPIAVRRLRASSPTTSTRASARWHGTTAIASWRGRRRRCSTATACGGCRSRCAPRPMARGRGACWSAGTTSRPSAPPAARPSRPSRRSTALDVTRGRRGDRRRGLGALVPAQPGALDGGLAQAGRRGQVERRRSRAPRSTPRTAPPAAPWRRRAGSIWCVWTIHRPTRSPRPLTLPPAPAHRIKAPRGRGGTGRHTGLKILRGRPRAGSSPAVRTSAQRAVQITLG